MKPIFKSIALSLIVFCANTETIFAQSNFYWVGGTGNWSDSTNHWATSSGGTEFHSQLPTDMDTVYFDSNSFTGPNQIVTIDTLAICYDFYWNQGEHMPTLVFEEDNEESDFEIQGSSTWGNVQVEIPYLSLDSHGDDEFFDPNGTSFDQTEIYVFAHYGSLELMDSLSVYEMGFVNMFENFSTNGHPINALESFELRLTFYGTIDLSGSNIYTKSFRATSAMGPNAVFNTTDVSINIIYPGGTTQIDKTRHPIPLVENYTIEADHTIQNEAAIFDNLIVKPGVELSLHHYPEAIEVNKLIARGNVERITVKTLVEGNTASILQNSGEVDVYMVDFIDVSATGSATFDVYASTGEINFDGWNFMVGDQTIEMEFGERDYEDINSAFTITPGASSGLPLDLVSSNENVAIISGPNEYTVIGMGTTQITANQAGDDLFNAADQVIRILEVTKASQLITFNEIEDISFDQDFYNLDASASSGLDITYDIVGPATLNNNTVVFTMPGTVQVTASQAGDDNYFEAEAVHQVFEILKLDQTIDFSSLPTETNALDESITLAATASSDLDVVFSVTGPATLDGDNVIFTGAGTVEIIASQDGDDLYNPAENIVQTIVVSKVNQTITFEELDTEYTVFDPAISLSASSSSGLEVTFEVSGPVELDGSELTITGVGMVEISAIQAGNDFYSEATPVTHSFEIIKAGQTIAFEELETEYSFLDPAISLEATSTSGLDVSFEVTGPVELDGSELTINGVGLVEISAVQAGNNFYSEAAPVSYSFEIVKADQAITFESVPGTVSILDGSITLSALVSSELAVSFEVTGPATLDGSTLNFDGAGLVEVVASQSGNDNFNAATPISQSFEIVKATQEITFDEIADIQIEEESIVLAASSNSGLEIEYQINGPASLDGTILSFTGSGTVEVTASQPGNDTYLAAEEVTRTFDILPEDIPMSIGLEQEAISFYPNPASDFITILSEQLISEYQVYSHSGQVMNRLVVFDNDKSLNIKKLNRGIYIVNIKFSDGSFVSKRIVKI